MDASPLFPELRSSNESTRRAVCGYTTKGYNRVFMRLLEVVTGAPEKPEEALREALLKLGGNSQVRESVRAKLRILVRRTLQRWKYPPDQQADAVELVLKQAEALSDEWSK